jgi:hypothetical protein
LVISLLVFLIYVLSVHSLPEPFQVKNLCNHSVWCLNKDPNRCLR